MAVIEKGKLAQRDGQPVGQHPAQRYLRTPDEEHRRHRRQHESQSTEQHGRHVVQADHDDHEVHSPDDDDHQCEQQVSRRHDDAPCNEKIH